VVFFCAVYGLHKLKLYLYSARNQWDGSGLSVQENPEELNPSLNTNSNENTALLDE
jgi:hypothetical protein